MPMQEQPAVISSSQPLEAQQRACYKNDSYCESNEPLYIHTICLGRTSKFRKEALGFFHFIGNLKKVIDKRAKSI